jgi:hypothetical protein
MGEGLLVDAWPDYMWVPYSVIKPTDPEQDYANPEVDVEWLRTHILVPGGADDPTVTPGAPQPAPPVHNGPNFPWPGPSSAPFPGWRPTPGPIPTSIPFPDLPPFPWDSNSNT